MKLIDLIKNTETISDERKEELKQLAQLIQESIAKSGKAQVNFICTHNSRRSQLSEILLRTIVEDLGIKNIETFSGGTEATAFNYRMVEALDRIGFWIEQATDGTNPHYFIRRSKEDIVPPMFSKKYDDVFNPPKDYIAVMVCDHADQNCPIVLGASHRFSLPFVDPKLSDNTKEEQATYDAKVLEIGKELFFLANALIS